MKMTMNALRYYGRQHSSIFCFHYYPSSTRTNLCRNFSSLINAWNEYPSLANKKDHDDPSNTNPPSGPVLLKSNVVDEDNNDIGGIVTLTLNRPHRRNALNRELLEALYMSLTDIATTAKTTNDVRAVIVQSEGPVFSSGHDLKELMSIDEEDGASKTREIFELCSETMKVLYTLPQPTICAVQGLATAAGLQLACSCDIVLASPRAAFQTPGVNIGLFCHTPAVPLLQTGAPTKIVRDMLLTGRALTSQEGLQYGLVSRVVGNPQKEAQKLAHQLVVDQSSTVVQMGKRVLLQQQEEEVASADEQYDELNRAYNVATQAMVENMELWDAKHGISAFLQKEKPQWKNQ